MAKQWCTPTNHEYRKFNERYIFCQRCGATMVVNAGPYYGYWPRPNPWITTPFWGSFDTWNTTGTAASTSWTSTGEINAEGREVTGSTAEPEGHEDDQGNG